MKLVELFKRRFARLGRDDRGVVMYYTALIACVFLAMFSVTYDVARVSEEKAQAQNAADAAALEMAVWQGRGMNMVQHINDEVYEIDKIIIVIYTAVAVATAIGIPLRAVYGIGYIIEGIAAPFAYIARLIRLTTVQLFLKPLRYIYANGAIAIGYISANNAATANGADPIIPADIRNSSTSGLPGFVSGKLKGLIENFTAIGLPTSTGVVLTLPLESKETKDVPLNTEKVKVVIKLMLKNTFIYPKDYDFWGWNDKYYQSNKDYQNKALPPMIWFVKKENTVNLLSQYFLFKNEDPRLIPIMAYSVGQSKGGNVVMYNDSANEYRPNCYGTGADAFLTPFDKIKDNAIIGTLKYLFLH